MVMPNHFHGIVENVDGEMNINPDAHVGAPLRGRPNDHITESDHPDNTEFQPYGQNNRILGATIGRAMDWFKTMTTNEYIRGVKNNGWRRFDDKLWQRNYHDHIIRDKQECYRISEYIRNNPAQWEEDWFRSNET